MKYSMRAQKGLCFFFFFVAAALYALEVPPLKGPVNDHAALLTRAEYDTLTDYLLAVDQQSDIQIAVLTIPSLEGEPIERYAMQVAEIWQIGKKEKDSGVILIVAANDRKIRIEVGYGLEAYITDADAHKIIRSIIAPYFKTGAYGQGITEASKALVGLALQDASLLNAAYKNRREEHEGLSWGTILFLLIIYFFGRKIMPGGSFWPFFLLFMAMNNRSGSGRGRSRSSFFSGKGGHFGSSGSSFSGGGGRFGGGGASGSW